MVMVVPEAVPKNTCAVEGLMVPVEVRVPVSAIKEPVGQLVIALTGMLVDPTVRPGDCTVARIASPAPSLARKEG